MGGLFLALSDTPDGSMSDGWVWYDPSPLVAFSILCRLVLDYMVSVDTQRENRHCGPVVRLDIRTPAPPIDKPHDP